MQAHAHAALARWLKGKEEPRSRMHTNEWVSIDQAVFLQPGRPRCDLSDVPFKVFPSNEMRTVVGSDISERLEQHLENDPSPLQHKQPKERQREIATALNRVMQEIYDEPELTEQIKADMCYTLFTRCREVWKAKYDLHAPCHLPPMQIKLKEGAQPAKIRRTYRWTPDQREFLAKHLKRLEDTGIISATDSPWCCPIVLVIKPDLTW